MLVTFLKPDQKTVQLQGHTLDIYLPSSQSEEEYSLGKNSALIEQFLLLGFGTTRRGSGVCERNQLSGHGNGERACRRALAVDSEE